MTEHSVPIPSMACTRCGASIYTGDCESAVGDLMTYRCFSCGEINKAFITRPLLPPIDHSFMIKAIWQHQPPTTAEMARLRSIVPLLARMPVADYFYKATRLSPFEFGPVSYGDARQIQHDAREAGIEVEFTPALPRQPLPSQEP